MLFFLVSQYLLSNGSSPQEYCEGVDSYIESHPSEGLHVAFATAFIGAGYRTAMPGDNDVAMGTWTIFSRTGEDLLITDFAVETMSADTGAYDWFVGGDVVDIQDHITSCSIVDDITGLVLDGPQPPSGSWRTIYFQPGLVVGSDMAVVSIYCDFSSHSPIGDYDFFAVDTSATLVQAENALADAVEVSAALNSDPSTGVNTPKFSIKLEN